LLEVVALDARGHEEALDEAQEAGDAGPAEEQVEYAEAVAAEVEVVEAEAAQEEGEQDAGDLVLFDMPVDIKGTVVIASFPFVLLHPARCFSPAAPSLGGGPGSCL
jgi:hypothetical protein